MPKQLGGLGILNLEVFHKALLTKWLWKLETEEGLWKKLLLEKYVKGRCISEVTHKTGNSQFWSGLMEMKDIFINILKNVLETVKTLGSGKIPGLMINL